MIFGTIVLATQLYNFVIANLNIFFSVIKKNCVSTFTDVIVYIILETNVSSGGLQSLLQGPQQLTSGVVGFIKDSARNIGDLIYRNG